MGAIAQDGIVARSSVTVCDSGHSKKKVNFKIKDIQRLEKWT